VPLLRIERAHPAWPERRRREGPGAGLHRVRARLAARSVALLEAASPVTLHPTRVRACLRQVGATSAWSDGDGPLFSSGGPSCSGPSPHHQRMATVASIVGAVVTVMLLAPGCGYARGGPPLDGPSHGASPFLSCAVLIEELDRAKAEVKAHPTDLTRRLRDDANATLFDSGCLRR
jgi:hypothetical protein